MVKPKHKFNGNSGKNARIKINYSKNKPEVRFSYPDKKKQSEQVGFTMFLYIFAVWFVFTSFFIIYQDANEVEEKTDFSNYTQCIDYYEDYKLETCEDREDKSSFTWFFYELSQSGVLFQLLIQLIPPFIIYFPFKKKWDSLYPKTQGLLARKKYRTFIKEDIIEERGNIYCEIPLFENILLNFNATEDFSKYLDECEIREHNFKYKYKRRSKKQNSTIWYARYYFTKKQN